MIEANAAEAKVTLCYLGYPHSGKSTDRMPSSLARAAKRVEPLLSDRERARAERLVYASDRACFVLAHALKRRVLAQLGAGPATELTFETDANGRPELVFNAPYGRPATFPIFSLSHTYGMVACAAMWSDDEALSLGLDIEWTHRAVEAQALADHYLAPIEAEWLRSRPSATRDFDFIRLWTMKEAVAKALGLGLLHPFDQFACDVDGATAHGKGLDDGIPLAVTPLDIGSEHAGSLALRGTATAAVAMRRLSLSDL